MLDLLYTISNSGVSFTLVTVDWGDGSDEETSNTCHTYSSSGTYKVKINSNSGDYQP